MDRRRFGRIKLIFTEVVHRFLYQVTYSIIYSNWASGGIDSL